MASLELEDGTRVPVTPEYLEKFKRLTVEQQIAEGERLMEQSKQPQAPTVEGERPQQGPPAPQAPLNEIQSGVGVTEDVIRSGFAGGRRGLEGILGTPQDLANLGALAYSWATGNPQEGGWDIPFAPSSEEIHQFTAENTPLGESYEPQTTAGKYAATMGEFAGGAVTGGGGVLKTGLRMGANALGGAASEAAGQALEGTKYETAARVGAGLGATGAVDVAPRISRLSKTEPGRAAERAAEDAARRHDVQLTKGQRTGDVVQQQKEEQMRHGAKGGLAQRLMMGRKMEQQERLQEARSKVADTAAPTRGATPVDSAANLKTEVGDRAQQLLDEGGAKIDQALKSGVWVDGETVRSFPRYIDGKLKGDTPGVPDVILSQELTPTALDARRRIDIFLEQGGVELNKPGSEVSLDGMEQLRRRINGLEGTTPADRRALAKVKEAFDDWFDATVEHGVTKVGEGVNSAQVLADLKEGRRLYREGSQIKQPRGQEARAPGAKEVSKIADPERFPEETARHLKPSDRGDLNVGAMQTIQRLKNTGATSREMDQVRGIVLDHLLQGDPGKVATRVENFLTGNSRIARQAFSQAELDELADFGKTNKALVPHPEATNPSRSSYGPLAEMGRMGGNAALSFIPGGQLIKSGLQELGGLQQARKALEPATRDTLARLQLKAGGRSAVAAAPGLTAAARTVTIDDEGDENFGKQVEVISEGADGFEVRLPNGQTKIIGKKLVRPLMVVRPNRPKHDELVQEASFLPAKRLLKNAWKVMTEAEKMEAAGKSPLEIFRATGEMVDKGEETGVWRNPANQWMFELGDTGSIKSDVSQDLINKVTKPGVGVNERTDPLSHLYSNELLFDREPWMKNQQTTLRQPVNPFDPAAQSYGGEYRPNAGRPGDIVATGRYGTFPWASDPWSLRSILTHEMQHGIQDQYGLPRGGSPKSVPMQTAFMHSQVPHLREIGDKMAGEQDAFIAAYMQSHPTASESDAMFAFNELTGGKEAALLYESTRLGGRAGSFQPPRRAITPATHHEQYKALAGEVEADLAKDRVDYDIDMKRAEPVFERTDRPMPVQQLRMGEDFSPPDPSTLGRFLQKTPIALAGGAAAAGAAAPAIAAEAAPQAPSKDEVMRNQLELARIRSAEADRRHTGADQPAGSNYDITPLAKSAATGAKHSTAETLGAPGDLQAFTGIGPTSRIPGKLPSSEELLALMNKLLPADYESKGPVEESYRTLGEYLLDPVNLIGGAIGKVRKLF